MSEPTSIPNSETPETSAHKLDPTARRLRMREFQTRLVDQMQAARGNTDTLTKQLGVLIGKRRCLIDLPQTAEIVAVGSITEVPLTQSWFLGLTNLRGNLISVVDFAQFLGDTATVVDKQTRIVAMAPALGCNSGLLVSQVLGLRNTADMQLQTEPFNNEHDWQRERFTDASSEVWQLIDLKAIARSQQFLQVAA